MQRPRHRADIALSFMTLALSVLGCSSQSPAPPPTPNSVSVASQLSNIRGAGQGRPQRVSPLYSFYHSLNTSGPHNPTGPLYLASNGDIYGTTDYGGNCSGTGNYYGTVYQIAPSTNTVSTIYSFTCGYGYFAFPLGVVHGTDGAIYGTTSKGGYGGGSDCITLGCGFIYKLVKIGTTWTLNVLFQFNDADSHYADLGFYPSGAPLLHSNVLYGVTCCGGTHGYGVAYSINSDGSDYQVIHDFTKDYPDPSGPLVMDGSGNLYGTVIGTSTCSPSSSCGSVFELKPSGSGYTFADLHDFGGVSGSGDGANPTTGVTLLEGDIYGTTGAGGNTGCAAYYFYAEGCGTIFKLAPTDSGNYTETILYKFTNSLRPSGLAAYGSDLLYGTTSFGGGDSCGVVFSISTAGSYTTLHEFAGYPDDGCNGATSLYANHVPAIGAGDSIWGATGKGGANHVGTLFELLSGSASQRSRRPVTKQR